MIQTAKFSGCKNKPIELTDEGIRKSSLTFIVMMKKLVIIDLPEAI
jgi:hypothetical protein